MTISHAFFTISLLLRNYPAELENYLFNLFGHITIEEIGQLQPKPGTFSAHQQKRLNELIGNLQLPRPRICQLPVSLIIPMEAAYYYYWQQKHRAGDVLRTLHPLQAHLST